MDYDNRIFRGRSNSDNGQVSDSTHFHYHQQGNDLTGTYSGGVIASGHLQGKVEENGDLYFLYHHVTVDGRLMAGECRSVPSFDECGKLVLQESWQWFTGDRFHGVSEVEEC